MLKQGTQELLRTYCANHPSIAEIEVPLTECIVRLVDCFSKGGQLLICGNGGSCADADHIVGELVKAFRLQRPLDELTVRRLQEQGEQGALLLPDDGLRVTAALPYREGAGFQLEVRVEHPDFFETMTGSVAGYAETDEALAQSAAGELGRALSLRYTPELVFERDDSIDKGAHILEVLRDVERREEGEKL